MKKIICYGTWDLLHVGHVRILNRAKALGDHLTVAVSTDQFNKLKGKKAYYSYAERKEILEALGCVDRVIMETNWEQKAEDIRIYGIDLLVMGDDWQGKFDHLPCEIVYLPRTEGISTTKIKHDIQT